MRFPVHFRRIGGLGKRIFAAVLHKEDGQALIMAALCFSVLLGFAGFATDVGVMFATKRKLQTAADAAAIAGAAELNYSDWSTSAQSASSLNGYTNGVNGATVTVNPSGTTIPSPLYGAYKGQSNYLEVIVSQDVPLTFMKLFNFSSASVSARSVATLGATSNCIYLLGSSGAGLTLSNNGKLLATGCGIIDDSASGTAMSVIGNSTVSAASIEVVGTDSISNSTVTPTPVTSVVPVSDPLSFLTPPSYNASECTSDPAGYYQGGSTYSVGPGSAHSTTQSGSLVCYTALTIGGNGNSVTVNSGTYVITGSLTFASGSTTPTATNVTFYLTGNGQVNIANGATFNLSAPTSGAYDGILFYQDPSDTKAATIEGGASSHLNGILYFPSASLSMGNGTSFTYASPIVAKNLTIVGGSTFNETSYSAINASSPLTYPRLVE